MKRFPANLLSFFLCLFMLVPAGRAAEADPEPAEALISAAVRNSCPDCRILDYAPVGQEGTEYIVLAADSADKPAVMIVNTEPLSAGVEFRNERIMEGIPADPEKVRLADHLADGNPYFQYTDPDIPDFLYVVFHKNEDGAWAVTEAQFGDSWNELYWFRYDAEDRQIHIYLTGNDVTVASDDVINRAAGEFYPKYVRLYLRDILSPYVQEAETGRE